MTSELTVAVEVLGGKNDGLCQEESIKVGERVEIRDNHSAIGRPPVVTIYWEEQDRLRIVLRSN